MTGTQVGGLYKVCFSDGISDELEKYIIESEKCILDALTKINENTSGFLIVENENCEVIGTLTDGDIRREIIKHKDDINLNIPVCDCCCKDYIHIYRDADFSSVLDIFKNRKIEFIPVIEKDKKLFNIITKTGLTSLLLQDVQLSLDLDFISRDKNAVNHEIFKKPWGFYKTTILNDMFQSKMISIDPSQSLSFQKHEKREEHWIIVKGIGEIRLEESLIKVEAGDYMFIPKGCRHRMINLSDKETLLFIEVQLGCYFGEDDIIRFEDCYGRF